MPSPVSRTVATIRSPRRRDRRRDLDAPGRAGRRDRVLRVHHHVQEHLVEQQRIALHARQLLVIVSHDFDVRGTARRRAQRQHLLQHGVQADRRGAPAGAIRRRPAGCARFSRRDRLRGKSSALRAAAASGRRRSRAAARGGRARPAAGCSARARCRRRTGRARRAFPTASAACAAPRARPRACVCGVRSRATRTLPTALALVVRAGR